MKQQWQRIVLKVDALSLRERVIVFAMLAIVLIVVVNATLLDPRFARQKQLSTQVAAEQARINQIQTEIRRLITVQADPDAANRERLSAMKQQAMQMQNALLDMQKGLVPPDKMTALLEDILQRQGKLRLLSLKTLPSTSLSRAASGASAAAPDAIAVNTPENGTNVADVYSHGVEIVVQGRYLEMLDYMAQLESMPWQLFWGKAALTVNEYPQATLTLTLHTLSLEKKWLNL